MWVRAQEELDARWSDMKSAWVGSVVRSSFRVLLPGGGDATLTVLTNPAPGKALRVL